ncbi:hypothetical protein H4Q26_001305 [Puccinia striiformis f. sp. tritici PST-130]|nr:hypothetical protein H4Q26_001305 [Puccinia striiformis f. sp. tritici PST-130]
MNQALGHIKAMNDSMWSRPNSSTIFSFIQLQSRSHIYHPIMLSFGWILSAVVALTLQQSSLAWSAASHGDTPHHLQKRYRIVGQPPPPCMHKICPLASRSEVPIDATVESDVSAKSNRATMWPDSPRIGDDTLSWHSSDGSSRLRRRNSTTLRSDETSRHVPWHPHNGACLMWRWEEATMWTSEKAPEVSHIPGTHQTAPINCGDGIKPPCGQAQPVTTPQRTPSDCGDGTGGPCVVIDPGREPPHADLLPKQTTASTNPNYHKTPNPLQLTVAITPTHHVTLPL